MAVGYWPRKSCHIEKHSYYWSGIRLSWYQVISKTAKIFKPALFSHSEKIKFYIWKHIYGIYHVKGGQKTSQDTLILRQLPSPNSARNEPKRFKTEIDIFTSFPFKIGNFPLKSNLIFFFYNNFFFLVFTVECNSWLLSLVVPRTAL